MLASGFRLDMARHYPTTKPPAAVNAAVEARWSTQKQFCNDPTKGAILAASPPESTLQRSWAFALKAAIPLRRAPASAVLGSCPPPRPLRRASAVAAPWFAPGAAPSRNRWLSTSQALILPGTPYLLEVERRELRGALAVAAGPIKVDCGVSVDRFHGHHQ